MTGCAAGCLIPGRHSPDCGGDGTCDCCCHTAGAFRPPCDTQGARGGDGCGPHEADPDCRGCLPRPATRGVLCEGSWQRGRTAVAYTSDLVMHLCRLVKPGAPAPATGSKATKAAESPLPLNAWALDSANAIYTLLVEAVEAGSDILGLVGPGTFPAWRIDGHVAGLPAGSTGVEAVPYATWLWDQWEHLAEHAWIGTLLDDTVLPDDLVTYATAVHRRAHLLIPPETRRAPVACHMCGARGIVAYTPTGAGLPPVLSCASCGQTFHPGMRRERRAS